MATLTIEQALRSLLAIFPGMTREDGLLCLGSRATITVARLTEVVVSLQLASMGA